ARNAPGNVAGIGRSGHGHRGRASDIAPHGTTPLRSRADRPTHICSRGRWVGTRRDVRLLHPRAPRHADQSDWRATLRINTADAKSMRLWLPPAHRIPLAMAPVARPIAYKLRSRFQREY